MEFYTDTEKKCLNKDLLDKNALETAKSFFGEDRWGNGLSVSSHQLRRFYNEVKTLEKKLSKSEWQVIFPLVKMLKSKVAYATSDAKIKRNEQNVYKNFRNFLLSSIDSITDEKDFLAFCKYFEAIVGFYYGEGGK